MRASDIVEIGYARLGAMKPAELDRLLMLLDADERRRNARFRVETPRRLHLLAHALLRLTLASWLDVAPGRFRFGAGPKGKPLLLRPASPVAFNLAHGGDLAVCALAASGQVGVDVEPVGRPELTLDLAAHQFAPAEVALLHSLAESERAEALVAIWTGKEAIIKAHGGGLSLPLERFVVPLGDGLVVMEGLLGAGALPWHLRRFRPDPTHRIALALASPGARAVRLRDATSMLQAHAAQGRT